MALTKVTSGVRTLGTGEVTAANLASGAVDTSGLEDDVALLGFKVASNGSLAKYNLVDQTVDDFQDTSGVDASASTNEVRDSSGKYYSGTVLGSYSTDSITATGAGTWTAPADTILAEVLTVAAGGGGGGYYYAGGGGAGGVVHDSTYAVTAGVVYDITVGTGGTAGTGGGGKGGSGSDSVFNVNAEGSGLALTAAGGGGAGSYGAPPTNTGIDGGSGGGAGPDHNSGEGVGGSSTQASFSGATSYGNAGGSSGSYGQGGSGGGGAGEAGNVDGVPGSVAGKGGYGGDGVLFSNFTSYGVSGYFGGGAGGGGGSGPSIAGPGGTGGGGNGAAYNSSAPVVGTANSGGGGGGGSYHVGTPSTSTGAAGGSGVVLIRHRTEVYNNMTLVSTTTAAQAAPTKGDVVFTYTDSIGTATLGTDLTAEISADGGSTWTAMTLGSEGSTGTHKIATAHDVTISSTITAPWNMAYRIKSLNQSGTKATRIQAVSLGWS